MTVQDILSPILRSLGYDLTDVENDEALSYDLLECVNDAVQAIVRAGDWAWLTARETITTEADLETVSLPEDFAALAPADLPYFAGSVAGCFTAASGDQLALLRSGGSTSGQPLHYQLLYSASERLWQFSLWPLPNAAYSIVLPYVRFIPKVAALDETPGIPEYLHPTLRLGARAMAEETFGREQVTAEKFRQALAEDWARYGSPDRGQRVGMMRGFGDPTEDLDVNLDGPMVVEVTS